MSIHQNEKYLAICYPLIVAFGFICSVTTAVAWNHWKYVLDNCVSLSFLVDSNCGCILKGVSTLTYFNGGYVAYCHWATFGLLLPIAIAIVFGCYHVFRVCFTRGKPPSGSHMMKQRSGEMIIVNSRTEVSNDSDISPKYWITVSVLSGLMAVHTLVHASMYLDGFLQTCRQYRNELLKDFNSSGQMVAAVQGRISCAAVFDFMDYIHKDVAFDRRRLDRINTAACLIMALIAVWASVVIWITIFVINIVQARKNRHVMV